MTNISLLHKQSCFLFLYFMFENPIIHLATLHSTKIKINTEFVCIEKIEEIHIIMYIPALDFVKNSIFQDLEYLACRIIGAHSLLFTHLRTDF